MTLYFLAVRNGMENESFLVLLLNCQSSLILVFTKTTSPWPFAPEHPAISELVVIDSVDVAFDDRREDEDEDESRRGCLLWTILNEGGVCPAPPVLTVSGLLELNQQ